MKYLALILVATSCGLLYTTYTVSNQPTHSVFIRSNQSISEIFKNDLSFKNSLLFKIVDMIPSIKNKIDTGEYVLEYKMSSYSFLNNLISGKIVKRKITFPEGLTVSDIIEKLNKNTILDGKIIKIPAEGSLFPSTYYYQFGQTKQYVIDQMQEKMQQIKQQINTDNKTTLTNQEILILASIIEKEVNNQTDRSLVSSVYHNRLRKKMRLQSDPTVKYARKLEKQENKVNLLNSDLFIKSPYNTYRNYGLPPTPICCPSQASIDAALRPAITDYLYFVSDIKSGKTYFSSSFVEHVRSKILIKKSYKKLKTCLKN